MKALFEGIQSITEVLLLNPLDGIRALELSSWFAANGLNFLFMIVGFVALVYWLLQLKKYDQEGKEDYSSTSHSYLG